MSNRSDYAIVVGIDHYSEFEPLLGARNDAQFFSDWLTSPYGGDLPQENITLILSRANPPSPRLDHVEEPIGRHVELFSRSRRPIGRRLYLFLSGHGITPPSGYEECALLMANANTLFLDRNIPGKLVALAFQHSSAFEEIVLFMDCCRDVEGACPKPQIPYEAYLPPRAGSNSTTLWGFATTWSRAAGERILPHPTGGNEPVMQGVFTHVLLDGLKRAVDNQGRVTGKSLGAYVEEEIKQISSQDASFNYEPRDIVICEPPVLKTSVHVLLRPPQTGFQIRDGAGLAKVEVEIQQVPNVQGIYVVALLPGRYLFATPDSGDQFESATPVSVTGREIYVEL